MRPPLPLPRALRPLRHPALACLWTGLATSAIGDQVFLVALSWVAVQVLGTRAGYLTSLQPAVILAVAMLAGHWADRLAPRRLMIAADLGRAAVLVLLLAVWIGAGLPPAWTLVLAVLALAAGQALFRPALQAVLPPLAGDPALLPAANGLLETTDRIARLVGPGLVGLLAAVIPLVHYVTIDVASFLASALAVAATLRLRPLPVPPAPPRGSVLSSMARGFRAMWSNPLLRFSLLIAAPAPGIWYAVMFLGVPLLVSRPGGPGIAGFGAVMASYGFTNLLAALVIGGAPLPRRPGRLIFAADVVLGSGLAVLSLAPLLLPQGWMLAGMCAGAAIGAVGGPMSDIPIAVLRQTRLAIADQAAAMRALLVMWNGGTLIALIASPALFASLGVARAMVAGSAVIIACGLAGLVRHAATPAGAVNTA